MRTSHKLLLRLYHDPEYDFSRAEVEYVNRGAPGDRSVAAGTAIERLDPGFMQIKSPHGTTPIPYHRILRIRYDGVPVWTAGGTEKDRHI